MIAECPQDENDLLHLYDADPARIDLVPCGFDRVEFHPIEKAAARERLGWPQDEFIVLQLGRMVPRKGVDNVVRALSVCRAERGESAELYVVGGNSDEANEIATPEIVRLRGIAREVRRRESCASSPAVMDAPNCKHFYNAADVFVTTPWYEPFGITPLEAMACGRPVIGADVGGIRYSVAHGETGLLVPPKDPAALARAIATLKRDPALARRMGEAGLARANAMFTWSSVAHALADVYARVSGEEAQAAARVAHGRSIAMTPLSSTPRAAIFIDKDGTLLEDVPWNVDPAHDAPRARRVRSAAAVRIARRAAFRRQQSERASRSASSTRGARSRRDASACNSQRKRAPSSRTLLVPASSARHRARYTRTCECRKPAPGMLLRAAREHRIDLSRSWFIGDILDDVEAGKRAGCRSVLHR